MLYIPRPPIPAVSVVDLKPKNMPKAEFGDGHVETKSLQKFLIARKH
jgi:hypothetical protein